MSNLSSLARDLRSLGVSKGDRLLVHSSLRAVGPVVGGPAAVILALEQAVGTSGTIVMPTFSEHLCDPKDQSNADSASVRADKLRHMPTFHADLTPVDKVNGFLTEVFRKQTAVYRSKHPHVSFAAWGAKAKHVVQDQSLADPLGERSPLARLYDLGAKVLLLGVGGDALTALHLAEYFVPQLLTNKRTWAAKLVDRVGAAWHTYSDVDNNSDFFPDLLADYESQGGPCRKGQIGRAASRLIPMPGLVDFGIPWLTEHR